MGKKIKRIILGVVVLLVVVFVLVLLAVDTIAKKAVEGGATYALGVDTTVDSVHLGLLSGRFGLNGLAVSNPQGFQDPHLMTVRDFDLQMDPGSLFSDTVQVRRFELDGVKVFIEQKGLSSNVSVVVDNLKRLEGAEGNEDKEGKRFRIDRILVKNVEAKVRLLPVGGEAGALNVQVPEIEVTDVSSDNANGVLVSEVVRKLVPAILASVVNKGGDLMPEDLAAGIKGGLAELAGGVEKLKDKVLDEAGEEVKEGLKDVGDKIGEGLGGLFGKD